MNPEIRLVSSYAKEKQAQRLSKKAMLAGSAFLAFAVVTSGLETERTSLAQIDQYNYTNYLSHDPNIEFKGVLEPYDDSKHYLKDVRGYIHRGSNLEVINKETGEKSLIDSKDKLFKAIYPVMDDEQLVAYLMATNVNYLTGFDGRSAKVHKEGQSAEVRLFQSPFFGCGSEKVEQKEFKIDLQNGQIDIIGSNPVGFTGSKICTD